MRVVREVAKRREREKKGENETDYRGMEDEKKERGGRRRKASG